LAIARKARQAITGYSKVEAAAEQAGAVAFLHASDGAPDGVRQIMAAIRRGYGPEAPNIVIIDAFTSAQMDLALARPNVVHAALLAGRASDTVLARWRILARFRMSDPDRQDARQPNLMAPRSGSE
ncbi:MAG TPA: DNA-binding protein, partial [Xanthobacteraceae bacterium]|nr:DNA-binding protein [Xanthobacteraceae bacterium]